MAGGRGALNGGDRASGCDGGGDPDRGGRGCDPWRGHIADARHADMAKINRYRTDHHCGWCDESIAMVDSS